MTAHVIAVDVGGTEIKAPAIPGTRLNRVAERAAQSGSAEKSRIESCSHPQRRPPVSGIGGALIKRARRSNVTLEHKRVAACQKLRDFGGRHSLARRSLFQSGCDGEI